MKRIIWHWTAGTYQPNGVDKKAYHFLISGEGTVHRGTFLVEANIPPLKANKYAAHTLGLNSDSIGVSLCAMNGAEEKPFKTGPFPITKAQEAALIKLTGELSKKYNIPVTPQTILSHAEVQGTLGVKQKNKWDITFIPSLGKQTPKEVGDWLRKEVLKTLQPPVPVVTTSWLASFLTKLFGGNRG